MVFIIQISWGEAVVEVVALTVQQDMFGLSGNRKIK
jgi:hypothetical protein